MICTKMVLSALLRSTLCRLGTIAAIASMTSFRSRLSFARYSYWMPNWDSRRQHQSASAASAMRAFKTLRQAPKFQQTLAFTGGLKGPFVATVPQQRLLHCEQACRTSLSPEESDQRTADKRTALRRFTSEACLPRSQWRTRQSVRKEGGCTSMPTVNAGSSSPAGSSLSMSGATAAFILSSEAYVVTSTGKMREQFLQGPQHE
jgi:hypothetical protein